MADPRFFNNTGPFSLKQLANFSGAKIYSNNTYDRKFVDVKPLQNAEYNHVSFLDNKLYRKVFQKSRAGVCIVHQDMKNLAPSSMILLISSNPYKAYAKIASEFYKSISQIETISEKSTIHNTAKIGNNCIISSGVVIEENTEIGDNCQIYPNAVIGRGCILGKDTIIERGATVAFCLIGSGVLIHSGVRIGGDGFGFAPGSINHTKVPQLGRVIIGNDVEIGSNTTIDRGAGPDTIINDGVKIDNLVQIGHNVQIGKGCIIVSQAGIAGSTTIGDFTMIGGQAAVAGHLTIGSNVKIAGQSGVMRDVESGKSIFGTPAKPIKAYFREITTLERLAKKKRKND